MRKILNTLAGAMLACVLVLFWPYTNGLKALMRHRDVEYDAESVLFLSFVGVFLQFIAGWRTWEWYSNGHSIWGWAISLAIAYTILCIIRLFLHLWGKGEEDDDEEAWNACHR